MSTDVKVVVSSVYHEEQGGNEWVYIKGRNTADDSGYQTRTFAEYKGTATKTAEALDSLNKGDYVLLTFKPNGKYSNLSGVVKLTDEAPASSSPATSSGGSGGRQAGSKMSKSDWADKDKAKTESIARSVALKAAVDFVRGEDSATVENVIETAESFEKYLLGGSCAPEVSKETTTDAGDPGVGDNDIPF